MDRQFLQILGSFFSPTIVDLALPFNNGPITNWNINDLKDIIEILYVMFFYFFHDRIEKTGMFSSKSSIFNLYRLNMSFGNA